VHRDLKPENIMLDEHGRVRVLDFGLAKATPLEGVQASTSANVTEKGRIIGTPGYMSPEQASGGPVDARSDVFSLGVVLYEMVTGVPPFACATRVETLVSIMRDDPLPAVRRNPRVPPVLSRAIERCLQKDPQRRFADASELGAELTRVRPSERSHSAARAAIAVGAAAVVAAGVWALHSVTRAPEYPTVPARTIAPFAPKPPAVELAVPQTAPASNPALPLPSASAPAASARADARPRRTVSRRPPPIPSARDVARPAELLGDPLATQK